MDQVINGAKEILLKEVYYTLRRSSALISSRKAKYVSSSSVNMPSGEDLGRNLSEAGLEKRRLAEQDSQSPLENLQAWKDALAAFATG